MEDIQHGKMRIDNLKNENMKKLLFVFITAILATTLSAQKMDFWLDAGLKAQYGFTALYNANTTEGNLWDNTLTSGTKYGVKLGINWNYTGISFDIMRGKTKGLFQDVGDASRGDREVSVESTDVYVLFRNAKHKGYFELGPKISFIGDVRTQRIGGNGETDNPNIESFYETRNLGAVLGFGTYILGPEDGRFSGIFGLRFEYGFQDLVNSAGSAEGADRQPVNYTGSEVGTTNPIFAGIVFELNWGIGGVGQARCGERSKFIWF